MRNLPLVLNRLKLSHINRVLNRLSLSYLWAMFFLYSVSVGLLVQFFILPILLPQYHMGNGLLDGGDWTVYHLRGVQFARDINELGWSAWELRPRGFGIIGFVSAVYAFTGIYEPFVLIPFFAMLHSIGTICIVGIICRFGVGKSFAVISALPFLMFPSSLLWVTQILKDGFAINGCLLILFGLIKFTDVPLSEKALDIIKGKLLPILYISIGLVLIRVIRPHFLTICIIFIALIFLLTIMSHLISAASKKIRFSSCMLILLTQIMFLTLAVSLESYQRLIINVDKVSDGHNNAQFLLSDDAINNANLKNSGNANLKNSGNANLKNSGMLVPQPTESLLSSIPQPHTLRDQDWINSLILPSAIDYQFRRIYAHRMYFLYIQADANTTVDVDYSLNSAQKMIGYIPRATQIAFLSPFPRSWFKKHPTSFANLTHAVLGIEMTLIYVCLIGVFVAGWFWIKKLELWIILAFSFYFALIQTYVFPNIGALVRYRYAALMILVAVGIAAFYHMKNRKSYIL